MAKRLKLYVWEDVLTDYTSGVMFALASSVEEARDTILKKESEDTFNKMKAGKPFYHGCVWQGLQGEPSVWETAVGFAVWGGG
jgi:hypothetical protein